MRVSIGGASLDVPEEWQLGSVSLTGPATRNDDQLVRPTAVIAFDKLPRGASLGSYVSNYVRTLRDSGGLVPGGETNVRSATVKGAEGATFLTATVFGPEQSQLRQKSLFAKQGDRIISATVSFVPAVHSEVEAEALLTTFAVARPHETV